MNLGIVADQGEISECLREASTQTAEHRVIWIASNGDDAVERCVRQRPDLVLMHARRGGLSAVEATSRIMRNAPCPILLVTAEERDNSSQVFEAMGHGAIDAVDLPALSGAPADSAGLLMKKIAVIARLLRDRKTIGDPAVSRTPAPGGQRCERLVAIGASAGGPRALATVLGGLPEDFSAAIVVVQHVDEQFAVGMAQWLSRHTGWPVSVAKEGDRPLLGHVLLAGTSDHLIMRTKGMLAYTPEPRHLIYRPSIDVFFESVERQWPGELVGVLLTGMGKDGANGLSVLRHSGYHTIAQDEATSAVYGMPKAAAALNAAVEILPVERIAHALAEAFNARIQGARRIQ